ncbi:PTS sugar transporter subunit IIB [Clostridium saudiense]|uniref:PTS sugar transporter subunit IIB n=1 Tax=Clostridium saudiense TaxID=1414720 RepID=UPI00266EA3C2|nr:PTS sugar transporter subunit IIB [Clostridium saudiense]
MNILLVCAAGMSTSVLVSKMKAEAEKQGKQYKIWAVGGADLANNLDGTDVILLGPQVRYTLNTIKKQAEKYNIPVEVIPMADYGMCNGENVLKFAEKLVEENK